MLRLALLTIGMLALGCASSSEPLDEIRESVGEVSQAIEVGEVVVYERGSVVPQAGMIPLDPAAFGAVVLEGEAAWSGRLDILEGALIGGVFQATKGKYGIVYPGVVHGTITVGEVIARSEGKTHHLTPGDSFLVTKGTYVEFETKGAMHQASFLGNFGSADGEAAFIVHQNDQIATDEELVSLGEPEDFNAVVIEGSPSLDARIDYAAPGEFGGIFQSTQGKYLVSSVHATEHGVVLRNAMTLKGADGVTRTLRAGDAYLVKRGGALEFGIPGPRMQHSFFAIEGP
jgi:uncharacterized protein